MVKRYYGGVMSASQITVNGTNATGFFNTNQQMQAKQAGNWPLVSISINYVTPGTYTFIVPPEITVISAMAIGGGGAGDDGNSGDGGGGGGSGGSAGFFSNLPVTFGQTLTIVVGAGGAATAIKNTKAPDGGLSSVTLGSFVMTAPGGIGGSPYPINPGASPPFAPSFSNTPAGTITGGFAGGAGGPGYNGGGGGGGGGGLNGTGGNGSHALASGSYLNTPPTAGGGGGGGGGGQVVFSSGTTNNGFVSGAGGSGQSDTTGGGGGGSVTYSDSVPSTNGGNGNGLTSTGSKGGNGGFPGGGGGGSWDNGGGLASTGGGGFVRIVWGTNASGVRQFPTNAGDI